MATRDEIIARARQIIQSNPKAGKERVNYFLRAEFGVGLRSATVLSLKASVAREHPELRYQMYEKGSVAVSLRKSYTRLREAGFLTWEAREFASQYKKTSFRRLPYIRKMVSWRKRLVKNLDKEGLNGKQIGERILKLYRENDWIKDGVYNPWAMLRAFRQRAIDEGEYIPQKRIFRDAQGNIRKIYISKGDIQAQKQRYLQRVRERRAGDEEFARRYQEQRRQQRLRARAREH